MSGEMEAKSWDSTQNSVQKLCYEWTISNFSTYMWGIQKEITSPVFSSEASEEVAWCLRVHTNGVDEESKGFLSVHLVLISQPGSLVWAKFQFWIINFQGEKFQSMKCTKAACFLPNKPLGFKKFLSRDFLLSLQHWLVPQDQLTLCCKVNIIGAFFSMPEQNITPAIKNTGQMLIDDLTKLWEKSLFTDCSLLVGDHEFRAHKAILAARSPVFRAMFEHEMQERLTNVVKIPDLDPQVFKEMMDFIYTGKAPHLNSYPMATGVLTAADRYGLEYLMVMCEHALCRILSVENAAHTLILADLHSRKNLKTQALNFIALHSSEVSETSEWKSMLESHPRLAAETFHSLDSAQRIFSLSPHSNA
ncbi:TD and POZ domain-containing protein 1-like [Apodemus sylvaticus]|uniref:TD and POZ domain-containing protein 1-like n=1 Tax=Apodemus sylvaticus TaxID=10129 RepID=UPI0022430B52|nr:TD and POZ domain-containing protein 1-like [Apodemus sylvaticus]